MATCWQLLQNFWYGEFNEHGYESRRTTTDDQWLVTSGQKLKSGRNTSCEISFELKFYSEFKKDQKRSIEVNIDCLWKYLPPPTFHNASNDKVIFHIIHFIFILGNRYILYYCLRSASRSSCARFVRWILFSKNSSLWKYIILHSIEFSCLFENRTDIFSISFLIESLCFCLISL